MEHVFVSEQMQRGVSKILLSLGAFLIFLVPLQAAAAGSTQSTPIVNIPGANNTSAFNASVTQTPNNSAASQSAHSNTAPYSRNSSAPITTAATGIVGCTATLLAAQIGGSLAAALFATTQSYNPMAVPSNDMGTHSSTGASSIANNLGLTIDLSNVIRDQVLSCLARALARAALQQVAISTINWINSGFNGAPSFVPNMQDFMASVADQAAGQYLASTNLAFLCSPFQIQVKIAVAQAYASGQAPPQCTLTRVTNNIYGFMSGAFDQGGWPAFIAFTTTPTNNPYGAYMASLTGLQNSIAQAQTQVQNDLQQGQGFLSFQDLQNCNTYSAIDGIPKVGPNQQLDAIGDAFAPEYRVCDKVTTTPGHVINDALSKVTGANVDSLINAKYFDEIINALISQLIQNTLYSGLSNLSSSNGYGYSSAYGSVNTNIAISLQQNVIGNAPGLITNAQQIVAIDQQNIAQLAPLVTQAQTLKQCWTGKISSSTAAQINASSTQATLDDLNNRVAAYQQSENAQNANIAQLQQLENQASATSDTTSLESIVSQFQNDMFTGQFAQTSDVTNAQEDQVVLQSNLSQTSTTISANQAQCSSTP